NKVRSAAAVLAPVLPLLGLVALLGGCIYGIFAMNCFGHEWAVGGAVAALLVGVVLGPRLVPGSVSEPSSRWQRLCRRLRGYLRKAFAVVLACWLGLLGWSQLTPGGSMPEPKADPASIRVVTWNIYRGREGPPYGQLALANWSGRKGALRDAL